MPANSITYSLKLSDEISWVSNMKFIFQQIWGTQHIKPLLFIQWHNVLVFEKICELFRISTDATILPRHLLSEKNRCWPNGLTPHLSTNPLVFASKIVMVRGYGWFQYGVDVIMQIAPKNPRAISPLLELFAADYVTANAPIFARWCCTCTWWCDMCLYESKYAPISNSHGGSDIGTQLKWYRYICLRLTNKPSLFLLTFCTFPL